LFIEGGNEACPGITGEPGESAARDHGRGFVGIDQSEEAIQVAMGRLTPGPEAPEDRPACAAPPLLIRPVAIEVKAKATGN